MSALTLLQLLVAFVVPLVAEIEMDFAKHPESVTAPIGDEVTFECAVRVPSERIDWRWRFVEETEDDWKEVRGKIDNDITSSRFVLNVPNHVKDSYYQCVVHYGSISLASVPARLTLADLSLDHNTEEMRVLAAPLHNTVVMHCKEPISEPPAVLTWWKEDAKRTRVPLDTPHGVLVLHNATVADSGTYGCTATNDISSEVFDLPERTYLKVQHEGNGNYRFLETEDYVGTIDKENGLTVPLKINAELRLYCGMVGTPPPHVTWSKDGSDILGRHDHVFTVPSFTATDEGVYSCAAKNLRRSWKVIALQPPHWEGPIDSLSVSEGKKAQFDCGTPFGQPPPTVHWLLNAKHLKNTPGIIKITGSRLAVERAQKRHAGVVQCVACNALGCAADAAMLSVVPLQISDQDYANEFGNMSSVPPKRHNKKNPKRNKALMVPPSRPNVTRISDNSVMVSWSSSSHGMPVLFFKVQFKEATNTSNAWHTAVHDIPPYINTFQIKDLEPDKHYKFRIAAIYSNQDNKPGRSSPKFLLQSGKFPAPQAPVLTKAVPLSPSTIKVDWTWSRDNGVQADGFYVYWRVLSTAGEYEKRAVGASARGTLVDHLQGDTAYEFKVQAYTQLAPSDFRSIKVAKTHRLSNATESTTEEPRGDMKADTQAPGALVTAGGALGATALLVILVVTLLLCRRAKRPPANKEKVSVHDGGGNNGYISAKVPMTITANPMHGEAGDTGIETSFLHNNNTGNNDDTLPHSRKNTMTNRQYV